MTTVPLQHQMANFQSREGFLLKKDGNSQTEEISAGSLGKFITDNERPPYHVVFSTSCEDQQNWESFVFFYHAFKVKQPGSVTRIASGCSKKDSYDLQKFHDLHIRTMSEKFYLHLTPDFSRMRELKGDGFRYKYINKPYGLRHWMEVVLRMNETDHSPDIEDGIVFLMDPDMVLLRPLLHDYTNEEVIFVEENPATKVVNHGFPIAQQDGYLGNHWMSLNVSYITNGGNIKHIKSEDGPKHFNSGPPYLATVRDFYNIAVLWTDYTPRVYKIFPKLFAEMFGYIFAATQLNLPNTLVKSFVISTTDTKSHEGWAYIDVIPNDKICSLGNAPLPVVLHYCQHYNLEKWFFSKYRLKRKYISCETPLLKPPPVDLATRNYTFFFKPPPNNHKGGEWNPKMETMSVRNSKRHAFMLCALISAFNEAAIYFKETACNGKANMVMNYTFWSDPNKN